jgi:hypothetical protein
VDGARREVEVSRHRWVGEWEPNRPSLRLNSCRAVPALLSVDPHSVPGAPSCSCTGLVSRPERLRVLCVTSMGGCGLHRLSLEALSRWLYRCDMPDSARDRGAAGDRAAQLNEQVAEGHEWAAHGEPDSSSDLHSDAASKHRQAAAKDRSNAQSARDEPDERTD